MPVAGVLQGLVLHLLLAASATGYDFYEEGVDRVATSSSQSWFGRLQPFGSFATFYARSPEHTFHALAAHSSPSFVALSLKGPQNITLVGCLPCPPFLPRNRAEPCSCFFSTTITALPSLGGAVAPIALKAHAFPLPPPKVSRCVPPWFACYPSSLNGSQAPTPRYMTGERRRAGAPRGPGVSISNTLDAAASLGFLAAVLLATATQWSSGKGNVEEGGEEGEGEGAHSVPRPPLPPRRQRSSSVDLGEWGGQSLGRSTAGTHRKRSSSAGPQEGSSMAEADPVPLGGAFELLVYNLVRQARAEEQLGRVGAGREALGIHQSFLAVFQNA